MDKWPLSLSCLHVKGPLRKKRLTSMLFLIPCRHKGNQAQLAFVRFLLVMEDGAGTQAATKGKRITLAATCL